MKRIAYSLLVTASLAAPAFAADMPVKAPPAPAAPASQWDWVVTTALMSDYNFRGITQSNHKPSVQGGFEVRYNPTSTFQLYAGTSGESIDFPNNAAAEIDLYGGIRPTFDKLALDFGFWEYYYPGGNCYNMRPRALHEPLGWHHRHAADAVERRLAATSPRPTTASGKSTARRPIPLTISGPRASKSGTRRRWSTPAPGAGTRSAT